MELTKETEQRRRKDLEWLCSLRPIDDDFMRCLFKDNIPLAQLVLRIITGKPDLLITECQTQKDMKRQAGARSVCLDTYTIFIIEKDFYGLGEALYPVERMNLANGRGRYEL